MHSIASHGLTTILSLALERQASFDIKEKLASISENELNVDAPDQVGNIPLMRGAENGHESVVKDYIQPMECSRA